MLNKITILENLDIEVDGKVFTKNHERYSSLRAKFIKRGLPLKSGATIEEKKLGRKLSSTRVQKSIRVEKKYLDNVMNVVQAMNMLDKILEKINEGQEPDVKPYTAEDISPALAKFWIEYFKNEKL